MDEKRLAAKTLGTAEETLYTNPVGAVIKTIMMYNSADTEKEVTLKLDSVTFSFKLIGKETRIIDAVIVTNSIKAIGEGVNIHISAIQL
ncbi:hypothetical protein [Clostridium culturomicium]|uniref:hypothetical protein n=1 Tax=Clostridium culturomicium TaxID=1499683 RepID=UPI003857767D